MMATKEYEDANEVFTQLVSQSESRSDAYGRLGLAALAFAGIPADSHKVLTRTVHSLHEGFHHPPDDFPAGVHTK
jgi:hypothetical protein